METVVFIRILLFVAVSALVHGCSSKCGERIDGEFPSSDRKYIATVFERDCGATTDFTSAVKLRSIDSGFRGEEVMYLVDGARDIKVTWTGSSALTIECDGCAENEIFKKEHHWNKVNILYGQTEWLEYGPTVVELEGELTIKTFFGPPNFGENPATDSREETRILVLDKPINVRAKEETDPVTGPSVENASELQLVFDGPLKELIGKKLIVKGTLFHAHTGHHFTGVLLEVESIRAAP